MPASCVSSVRSCIAGSAISRVTSIAWARGCSPQSKHSTSRPARSSGRSCHRRDASPTWESRRTRSCRRSSRSPSPCGRHRPAQTHRLRMPAPPESQTSRYFAWLYAPTSERPLLEALLAIEREVSQSLATTIDHQVAHIRLQWWREELIQLAQGGGTHPLTRTLTAAFGANRQPDTLAQVVGLVENAGWDLARATFENRTELTAYCERWAAALIVPLAAHAGRHAQHLPAQHLPAQHLPAQQLSDWLAVGASMRELEMLTDLARDARSGRLRLPLDELQRADLDPEGLAKPPWPEGLVRLVR